ncbi:hypothetical protein HMPREF0580_0011 [Mobiluncus mulieris ATCC 35239]|uniref:Uncharacterized protein n=1 Tax=Mobiluncus mulieris ATCC 35239 TaxID=871571 RepID=E0QM97_9ACTO|nr:hypothetical protein HMPREF0580_0011 [Mobiluncus mulieris ATCC 35239]
MHKIRPKNRAFKQILPTPVHPSHQHPQKIPADQNPKTKSRFAANLKKGQDPLSVPERNQRRYSK